MNTAKVVKKFCFKTMTPYKRTLKEVRSMSAEQRGLRKKAMKEFLANKHIGITEEEWTHEAIKQKQFVVAGKQSI